MHLQSKLMAGLLAKQRWTKQSSNDRRT